MSNFHFYFLLAALLAACGEGEPDTTAEKKEAKVEVLTKRIVKKPSGANTGSRHFGHTYWIEGKVQNRGNADAEDVLLSFTLIGGEGAITFTAKLDYLPARDTLEYETNRYILLVQPISMPGIEPEVIFETIRD
ncbi:MAG: hypothetical protein V3U68_02840 [Bacteroidota bacterium]